MMITPAEYYDKLERHDWFWYMADDGGAYARGEQAERELSAIADEHDTLADLFHDWETWMRPVNADGHLDTSLRLPQLRPVRPDDGAICGQLRLWQNF